MNCRTTSDTTGRKSARNWKRAAIARNRSSVWKFPSRTGRPGPWGFRRCWTASFSKPSRKLYRRNGNPTSIHTVTASGRNARRYPAIREVQTRIRQGHGWVVDMDLQAFFDRVNHDRLMARLKSRCPDVGLLRLVNRYLKAGVSVAGNIEATPMGVPQGGPLSPVLANVVLDELDWELDRRGHRFARYADDCNIPVRSKRAGKRVMASVTRYVSDTLRLTVNPLKSAVDRPMNRKFLGFTVSRNGAKLKVADKAIEKLKDRVRELTRRTRGTSIGAIVAELRQTLLGWKAYFGIAEVLSPLRDIDKWVRRKLRCYLWKQWGPSGYRELRKRGVSVREAWNTSKSAHGPWRLSKTLPLRFFTNLGLPSLAPRQEFNSSNRRIRDPYVRWCGREGP